MSLFRILQERRDEWISSLRGLDGIEAKPKIYNEMIPVFAHCGPRLGFNKDLRTDEQAQKDFTPFINKKPQEYLDKLRASEWLDANMPNTIQERVQSFFTGLGGGRTAREAYVEQDEPFGDFYSFDSDVEEESDVLSRYTGQSEDEDEFADANDEPIPNPHLPGTLEHRMVESRNQRLERYHTWAAVAYKARQMESLSLAFQSARTTADKQEAYDNFLAAWARGGNSEDSFINMWGMRPEEAAVGGGGSAAAVAEPVPVKESPAYVAWNTYTKPGSGYLLGNKDLQQILSDNKIPRTLDGKRASNREQLITLLIRRGIPLPT